MQPYQVLRFTSISEFSFQGPQLSLHLVFTGTNIKFPNHMKGFVA